MIAYLEKYDTTVDLPDDMGEKEVKDVNDNFHNYVDTKPAAEVKTPASAAPASPGTPAPTDIESAQEKLPEQETPKWQPNFYGAVLSRLPAPIPQAAAYLGKEAEELTFGAAKPLIEPIIGPSAQDHPAFAGGGEVAGGMGSLLEVGGALRIAGLAAPAAEAGKAVVEAGAKSGPIIKGLSAMGERFIPRAIMTGATFGTRTFIAETIKAFHDGGVNLEQFGKDVLKDTAFGGIFGSIGGMDKPIASISSAGALGFISSKMQGGDNREASLNAAIWGAFETVGSMGKSEALRLEALNNLKESIGEYARGRNPDLTPEQARGAASAFVDHAVTKAGFKNAEAIAKSGPENLLEGIEKVNQMVRTAQVPHPGEPGEPLPKLPAPAGAAAPAGVPATPEEPKSVLDTAIDKVKGMLGIEKPPEVPAPAPAGPQPIEKSMADIGERLTVHGLKETEKEAIFNHYTQNLPEMIRQPLPDQYRQVYDLLAKQRGITGDKFDSNTIDQAEKAVDLINDHFGTKSQELLQFAQAHPEASVNEVAQMAHDRGMMESPNPDLLNAELRKATKEQIPIQPEQGHQPMEDVLYQADLDKFNTWRDIISQGIQPPKTGEMDEYNSLPLWMKNSAGRPYDEIAQEASERGLIKPGEDIFSTLRELKRPLKSESGAVMIPPDLADVAEHIRATSDEISNLVAPAKAAPLAAQITRANLGKMARAWDMAEAAVKEAHTFMGKRPNEPNIDFMDRIERGIKDPDPKLEPIAKELRDRLDAKRNEVQDLGTGKLKQFNENYFPHIWDQGEKEVGQAVQKGAKRPFEGSKAFLKARSIQFIKEGIEAGLTPVSFNPVELVLLKMREMDKYIMAHKTLNEFKDNGLAQFVRVGADIPEGWTKIDDRISTVMFKGEQGLTISGHIYAQPDAARIINNYLAPGLQGSSIYQAYRYAGNLMNQFQLGLSAFHMGFVGLEGSVSKLSLAIRELSLGHPLNAIREAIKSPFAAISTVIRGDQLLKAWRGEGQAGIDNILATAMAEGGGRARMDQFYATQAYEQMKHYFETGRVIKGILSAPFAALDLSMKPTLEWYVPRMKMGAFADIMEMELRNNPNMTHGETVQVAQRAWDSIDNRFGQLVYDNLFWNRTFKDLLMASQRSVGWNLGTIREIGGGAIDVAKMPFQGKNAEVTDKASHLIALPLLLGALGAMIQYLRTGKGPQTLKDYYFPQSGGFDAEGNPHRSALPSYMKDIYHYTQDPIKTITGKLSPLLSTISEMIENKDYYGTKIRNEDDPLVKQVGAEAAFIGKQLEPFSIRNMQKNLQTGNHSLFDTVGPWVGITPAPYDINQTKAEQMAHEIMMSHQEIGGRTEEQAQRSRLLSELTRNYKMGDPKAVDHLEEAYQKGLISHRQMQNVIVNSEMTPLQRMVKGMTLQEAERVYSKANDEEKAQIGRMVERKQENRAKEYVTP